jgi:hypothetical protein
MTGSRVDQGPHIDDGDLIRLFDGECSPEDEKRLGAHIDFCAECKSNAESLHIASKLFSESLLELDIQTPAEPTKTPTVGKRLVRENTWRNFVTPRVLRAAAVLAAMVIVFSATPARAWLVRGWEAFRSFVASESVQPPDVVDIPAEIGVEMSSILRFTPRGPEFRLEFTERQAAGTLVLLFDSTTSASAGILGENTGDEMILLPDGLRVRNSSGSTTSYEVQLPLTLLSVDVRIGGTTILRLDLQSLAAPLRRELDLTGGIEF